MRKLAFVCMLAVSNFGFSQEEVPEPLICLLSMEGTHKLSGEFSDESSTRLPDGEFYNGRRLLPDGYNEISNPKGKLILQGYFGNRSLVNGYHYFYDKSGEILLIDIYREGKYICSCDDCYSHIEKPREIVLRGSELGRDCFLDEKIYLAPFFAK